MSKPDSILLNQLVYGHTRSLRDHLQGFHRLIMTLSQAVRSDYFRLLGHDSLRKLVIFAIYPCRFSLLEGQAEGARRDRAAY